MRDGFAWELALKTKIQQGRAGKGNVQTGKGNAQTGKENAEMEGKAMEAHQYRDGEDGSFSGGTGVLCLFCAGGTGEGR